MQDLDGAIGGGFMEMEDLGMALAVSMAVAECIWCSKFEYSIFRWPITE